jgi:hypothetical protein
MTTAATQGIASSARERLVAIRTIVPAIAFAFAFRAVCYAVMTAMALWNERRPSPTVPDLVLSHVPYMPWVSRVNYLAWLLLYMPIAVALLWTEPRRWVRYMVSGGIVSLVRGVCIALTGLGPPDPAHTGPGVRGRPWLEAYVDLLSPIGVFVRGSAHAYLTKDLFFSGHTATTFMLVLYLWHRPRLRWLALGAHAIVVTTVFLAHLHYAIDVAGAYAFTFAVFVLREGWPVTVGTDVLER